MKKEIKYKSDFSKQEITFTVDEALNKLKGKVPAPKKPADANRLSRKLKSPPPQ